MRKSGLHKQVAFIFEGAPESDGTPTAPAENADECVPARRGFHPDRAVSRPTPAPKGAPAVQSTVSSKTGAAVVTKKSRHAEADGAARRQKTMTLLVGVLSVVFLGVMVISFGGIGQSTAAPAVQEELPAAVPVSKFDPDGWVFPEPLPAQMRNPMVIPKPPVVLADPESDPAEEEESLAVRGIVHSHARPSAIIGDQIVVEGQMLRGVKVIKITPEAVEFEKDGNRWSQQVE